MEKQPVEIQSKRREYTILVVLGTLIAIGPFSVDMYLPSFESIADEFSVPKASVGFSLTSYFVGIALGQLAYGPVMDRFGRKIPLLIGLVLYILAALSCYFSPDLTWLIISRFFLAHGASAGMVASKAVVRDIFPAEQVAGAISFLMLIMGGAPILAPTVGGLVIAHFSWQTIFMILAGFAGLMFLSVKFLLPESFRPDKSVELKPLRVLDNYREIFRDKIFLTFSVAGGLTVGALFAYISNAPTLFMDGFDLTESQFGYVFGANAGGYILGTQINRFVLKRNSTFQVSYVASLILFLIGLSLLLVTSLGGNFYAIAGLLFSMLMMLGFQNPNTTALSLHPFTRRAGRASALVGSLKMIVGACSSYLISELSENSLIPLAIIVASCLFASFALILNFKIKNKRNPMLA